MSKFDHIEEVNKHIDHIDHVEKFNPYHDSKGRFASASGYSSFTFRTKDPKKQHMADMAIARAKENNKEEKTKKAPEDRIKAILPAGAVVDLKGCDPDLAAGVADSFEAVFNKYPKAKEAVKEIVMMDTPDMVANKALAGFDQFRKRIVLSKRAYEDKEYLEEEYKKCLDQKFHPEGTDINALVVHEIGHALDHHVSYKVLGGERYFGNDETISGEVWDAAIDTAVAAGIRYTNITIRDNLSVYASSHPHEYFAEAFCESMCSSSPREAATNAMAIFDSYYNQLGGGAK